MRKILLGTTAVVGAALLGATVAQAQTAPTVRVGGYFEFSAGYIDDDADKNAVVLAPGQTVDRDKVDFRSDMEISIIVRGKAANGLVYGAEIEFQMDANNTSATAIDTDEMWMFVQSPTLGTLQFGDQDSAADQIRVGTPGLTNLGISGGWDEWIAPNADGTRYLLSTINDGSDATKIIYLSPQFFGFDFGVSYAPNGFEGENFLVGGGAALQRDPNQGTIRNEISGAVRYRGSFGNVGVAASFGAMRGDAPDVATTAVQLQDPTAYEVGASVSAFGFTLGGQYLWGKYAGASFGRTAVRQGLDGSSNWSMGLTYSGFTNLVVGAFYGSASRDNGAGLQDREQTAWGLGVSYNLAPGLELFANYVNLSDENIANSAQNPTAISRAKRDADVFILGTRLAF